MRIGGDGFAKAEDGYLKLKSTNTRTLVDTPVTLENVRIDAKVYVQNDSEDFMIGGSQGEYDSYANEKNGYDANWNGWPGDPDRQRLRKYVDGSSSIIAQTSDGLLSNGNTYLLSWIFLSPTLKMMNDNSEILSASDSSFSSLSYLFLAVYSGGEYWIDWVLVRKYTEPQPVISVGPK